jgi:hypothetical protein
LRPGGSAGRKVKIKDQGLDRAYARSKLGRRIPSRPGTKLRRYKGECLFLVLDQGEDVEAGQFGAAMQEGQFYREGGAFDGAAELLD